MNRLCFVISGRDYATVSASPIFRAADTIITKAERSKETCLCIFFVHFHF